MDKRSLGYDKGRICQKGHSTSWVKLGGKMEFLSGVLDGLGNINWEVIAQLVSVGLIMIAGPVVIFVLAFRNGNL